MPAGYRTWSVEQAGEKQDISQFSFPIVASVRLSPRVDLVLSQDQAISNGSFADGEESSLSGTSNVTGQIYLRPFGERILVQAGINLPTGKTGLSEEEARIAGYLAHPLLGFRVKEFGGGLDFGLGGAVAFPLGSEASLALGVGFIRHGTYDFTDDLRDYRPGAEGSFSAGIDLGATEDAGAQRTLSTDLTYRLFAKDERGSETFFEEGDQLEAQLLGALGSERYRLTALARLVWKDDNVSYVEEEGVELATLPLSPGTGTLMRLALDFGIGHGVDAGVAGEWKHQTGSGIAGQNGDSFGFGPTMEVPFAGQGIRLGALVLSGSAEVGDEQPDMDLSGFAVTAILVYHSPR